MADKKEVVIEKDETVENEEVIEKPYTLRKFKADDTFCVLTLIKNIGFKQIKSCFDKESLEEIMKAITGGEENTGEENTDTVNIEAIGFDIAMNVLDVILTNIETCKGNIYQLLSRLSGMTQKEIADLDAEIFIAMIVDVVKGENTIDFFKAASKLLK